MNRRVLVLAIIAVLICGPAKATADEAEFTHCAQIAAWVMGGISSQRAMQIVKENRITVSPDTKDVSGLPALQQESDALNSASGCTKAIESGSQLLRSKRYEDAEGVLHRSLTGDSRDAAIHFALGALHQMQGDWDGAFDESANPNDCCRAYLRLTIASWNFYHSDDGENAIAEARTALSIDPRNAVAYRFLGLGFYSNGMSEAALHAFEQSLLFEPENRDTFYDIGLTLQAQNYKYGAMGAFRHALKLDPELWEAHYQLAAIFLARGRFERAIEEYGYAKRLVPAETKICEALADLYFQNGDFSAASREFSQLLSLNSRSDTAHFGLARDLLSKHHEAIDNR